MPEWSEFSRLSRAREMSISHITPLNTVHPQGQGAVIRSVATPSNHRIHYGVQSATFVRTVFPGQPSGTYRTHHMIPTWRGPQITANPGPTAGGRGGLVSGPVHTGSSRVSAGSPPVPFPPRNASAFYSQSQSRIIPNVCFNRFG